MGRSMLVLALAGCATPEAPPRDFVHPASSADARLIEVLDAAPKEKEPPGALDYVWKTPLVVPTLTIAWAKDTPRALAAFALTPVALVGAVLEAVGILKPDRSPAPPEPDVEPRR